MKGEVQGKWVYKEGNRVRVEFFGSVSQFSPFKFPSLNP